MALPSRSHPVQALVRSAHRRSLLMLAIEQISLAASVVCLGALLMLLLGTQILNSYWLLGLVLAGAVFVALRLRRRAAPEYVVAQTLDQCLHLHDTISTAWYLEQHPELQTPAAATPLQQAENLVRTVDPSLVFPFRGHRQWTITGVLFLAVFALFAFRYFTLRTLNLKASLVPVHLQTLVSKLEKPLDALERTRASSDPAHRGQSEEAALTEPDDARMNDIVGVRNPAMAQEQTPGTTSTPVKQTPPGAMPSTDGDLGDRSIGKPNESGTQSSDAPTANENPAKGNQAAQNSDHQPAGLVDRMKDAMSSLMAKMNPATSAQPSQQATNRSAAPANSDSNKSNGDQSQTSPNNSQNSQSNSNNQSDSEQQGQATEMAQAAQSKSGKGANNDGSNQSKSGVGAQDGDKAAKEAAELQAMGKLAEIIGKRSRNVTGEVMVEAGSGRQQLRTNYTGRLGNHSDTGSEINRDEVPLMLRQYVRDYMDRVRRDAQKNSTDE